MTPPAYVRWLFRTAIFLASFLLFLSEPIAAKQLLPVFGGSAAVWMTCLVFFQVALLAGYLYAHAVARSRRLSAAVHVALLVVAAGAAIAWAWGAMPLGLAGAHPVWSIFGALTVSIGLPFVMLASTSPLLQAWLARREQSAVAYGLFALSNLASLLALVAYPWLIEPHLSLTLQRELWAAGVVAFALIAGLIAWTTPRTSKEAEVVGSGPRTALRTKLLWFLLPMAAAMQLSAVTAHLTSNIAAIPLLWIVPLAVYLVAFILAFQIPQLAALRGITLRLLAVMLAGLGYLLAHTGVDIPIGLSIGFFLAEAFFACLFCLTEAYALRPADAAESTEFYLLLAAGGAAGSFLIGIAAPLLFSGNYDLAITFLVTALLATAVVWNPGVPWRLAWPQRALWATGSYLLMFLVMALHIAYHRQTLLAVRNFYGGLRVQQSVTERGDTIRTLVNGTIVHGNEIFSADLMHVPTTYYAPDSGVGFAMANCCVGRAKRVGVIGLGAGTIAAYGKPGDRFRFYEINPAVLPVAQNLFNYLHGSPAQISFAEGDGRASLRAELDAGHPQGFDVLVIDAFSGDAIPLHLLTVEAMAIYRRHMAPGGVIAFHISNAHVNLAPEVAALAAQAGMQAWSIESFEDKQSGETTATWELVTDNPAFLDRLADASYTSRIPVEARVPAWTDNYSALLPLVHW